MRAKTALLTAALTVVSTASFAQSSYNVVVEPVGQTIDSIIRAPIEYDENGVMKAQHFNADNLTDEEYQVILDEAARIRAYRDANGLNFESDYVSPEYIDATPQTYSLSSTPVESRDSNYQIELFAPETPTYSASTYAAPTTSYSTSSAKTHRVSKGETLYRISKLYGVSIADIQAENAMTNTTLSVGQTVRIPGAVVESAYNTSRPIYANSTNSASTAASTSYNTTRVVEPVPVWQSSGIETSIASEAVYGVLKKDTLYSISRRSCVSVKDIIARNGITNPNVLTPGQYLTLPAGHCLAR